MGREMDDNKRQEALMRTNKVHVSNVEARYFDKSMNTHLLLCNGK